MLLWLCYCIASVLLSSCAETARTGAGSAALTICDDGNPCTGDVGFCPEGPSVPLDLCPNLECFHAPYVAAPRGDHPFDDGNPCTIDTCDPEEGILHEPAPGATCDTDGDICSGIGICDTAGQCVVGPSLPDGAECDDGAICNGIDVCQGGVCQPVAPATAGTDCWNGLNECVSATCNGLGECIESPLPGRPCDDGSACTAEDLCDASGQCAGSALADGSACADGDACNGAETCHAGACVPGAPVSVDDGEPRTLDTCDPATGTVHHADCSAILDLTVTTTLDVAARCLYEGPAPLQVALDASALPAGTFDPKKLSIVRGRVRNSAGVSLDSVTVTAPKHPGWGKTFTRADGWFDLVVEAGAPVVVRLSKPGHLTAHRTIEPAPQQYAFMDEAQLTARNPVASPVTLGGGPQLAKGTLLEDQRGKRQAAILFPSGTGATATLPDGSQSALSGVVHVRATEYTFGTNAQASMPAPQPPSTTLTYCAEFSIDEAEALGAARVDLSQPVYVYVDNFLKMRVGAYVPSGYFDEDDGVWKPSEADGLVVQVKEVQAGLALLTAGKDANGADIEVPDLTAEEQEQIALLYPVGKTFWRMPVTHFTTYDFNYGNAPPDGAEFPDEDLDIAADSGPDTSCSERGSIVGCEDQTLGEALPITGSGLQLFYDSTRVPGRMSVLRIPVQKNVHPDAIGTVVEVSVAGHHGSWTFDKDYEGILTVAWSGHDAMGRLLQGAQPATVVVGNRYESIWGNPGAFGARGRVSVHGSGGGSGGGNGGGGEFGGYVGSPQGPVTLPGPPIDLRRHYSVTLGHWNSVLTGLGGWSIEAHHAYDVLARTLYRGDGTRVHADTLSKIQTFAGNGVQGSSWSSSLEGASASAVGLYPQRIAAGADGSLYVVGFPDTPVIVRIAPDRTLHGFAGTGQLCSSAFLPCGNGGPALSAALGTIGDIAVGPDGSVYVAEMSSARIRRVRPDGIIEVVAGNGQSSAYDPSHEGMLATQTPVELPTAITVGSDGSLYLADGRRVHRVDPSGRRWHMAGNGSHLPLGTAIGDTEALAPTVPLGSIAGLALSPGGDLLIAHNHLIGAVTPQLTYRHVAGGGPAGYQGDGGPAHQARLAYPMAMVFDADGSLIVADSSNDAVRRIAPPVVTSYAGGAQLPNGRIRTIAGRPLPSGTAYSSFCPQDPGPSYLCGDGGVSTEAFLQSPRGLALGPAGKVFVALTNDRRVAVVEPAFPGYGEATILVPSPDADEYYLFDAQGRHLETRSALTNARLFGFDYDPVTRRLTKVRDIHGQELVITGSTIATPGSPGDTYALNAAGYLESLTNPQGETFVMTYHAPVAPGTSAVFGDNPSSFGEGLLHTFTTPGLSTTTFTYDAWGRLISDLDAAGGALNLDYTPAPTATGTALVEVTGRPTGVTALSPRPVDAYEWQRLPTGDIRRKVQSATGVTLETTGAHGGSYHAAMRDAAAALLGELDVTAAPDPRFGPYAGYARTTTVVSGGITQTVDVDRAVTLGDPDDILSATALDETITVAGRTWQSHFDVASRIFTMTSPEGRVSSAVLDAKERVTSITPPGREPILVGYDPVHPDRISTIQIGTTTPRVTSLAYDAAGRLDVVTLPNDPAHSFEFDVDDAWRTTAITDPLSGALGLDRDDDGNVTTVTMPDQEAHGLAYTPVNLLQAYTPPVVPGVPAPQTDHVYNLNRTVDHTARPDGHVIKRGYDAKGRLESVTFDAGTLSRTYDDAGRTETATRATADGTSTLTFTYLGLFPDTIVLGGAPFGLPGDTYTVDQGYNAQWLLQSESVAGKTVTYAYDGDVLLTAAGPLTAVRDPQGGHIVTTTLGTVGTSHAIDPALGTPAADAIAAGGAPLMAIDYAEYDAAGRLKTKVESVPGEPPVTHEYTYDHRGWLTDETRGGVLVAHLEYDANGNRIAVAMGAGSPARIGAYDDQDRLTQLGAVTYSYTANGELHQRTGPEGTTTYTYDDLGVLISVDRPDGTEIRYVADPLGRRLARLVNGQVERGWLYGDGSQPLAEVNADGEVTARFVYLTPGAPDVIVRYDGSGGETRYRVFKDHLGSLRLLVHAGTGAVAQRIDYDVLGRVLSVTGTLGADAHPFGFAGGLHDPDTGLVRFGARDYDPETGRFTAKDPSLFEGGLNLYRYAENDPVNVVDPTGRAPVWLVPVLAAGFFTLSMGAILDNDTAVSTLQVLEVAALIAGMKCLAPGPRPPPMRGCFTGDTEVVTREGPTQISEVSVGDEVWSFDAASGAWAWRPVSETFVHPHEGRVVELGIGDDVIEATPNHPVCVASGHALAARPAPRDIGDDPLGCGHGGRWVEAGDVLVGDTVVLADGSSTVASVSAHEASLPVYNISVEGSHTYAVSAEGVLVHNKAASAGGQRPGKPFTRAGKREVKANNAADNSGQTTCTNCGQPTVPAQQSQRGVTPPRNETHVDHIVPKSRSGSGTPDNGQVLCRDCNLRKGPY